ncbi:MAG TPA: DinB family protein [Ardenticatenaceae bacterium]|nr:DinB family protein [Ardenticatenaceae bacterium]
MAENPIDTLTAKLEGDYQHLLETIAGISEERLVTLRDGDGWSIRDILAHVANASADHRRIAQAIVAGSAVTMPGFDLDAWNRQRLAERSDQDVRTILDALNAEHARLLALLARLAPGDLEKPGHHPALGDTTVGKILRIVGLHQRMHQRDIAGLLAAAPHA